MTRPDDLWWWQNGGPPAVTFAPATLTGAVDSTRITATGITTGGFTHLVVAVTASKGSSASPPSSFQFFADPDLTEPVTPVTGFSLRDLGNIHGSAGDADGYAYGYILNIGDVYMRGAGGVDTGYFGIQAFAAYHAAGFTANELTDLSDPGDFFPFLGPQGETGDHPHWLFIGYTSASPDTTTVAVTEGQISDSSSATDPVVSLAGIADTAANRTIEADGLYDATNIQARGWWIQFQAVLVEEITPVGLTLWTGVFEASLGDVTGIVRGAPPVTATNIFDADLILPSASAEWRAVLVDAAGNTVHQIPDANLGDLVETLNDITVGSLTIPVRSPAASAIDDTDLMAELEVQIWRGNILRLWGPITAVTVNGDLMQLKVSDAPWHLTQRHVGQMGNEFGGKPPYFHDPAVNLRFQTGDLEGWSILRTISIGEFVGFGAPYPGAVTVDPTRLLPSGEPAVRCHAEADPLDNYQLFQDLSVVPPQNGRALRMTLSGWWWIPVDGGFAPNNQRMGLLLAPLIDDPSLPADYYQPFDVGFSVLDDTCPRGQWFYQECEVDVPPGAVPRLVHVAVCFPQGISYVAGLDLQVDDGLLYDESPSTMGAGLVMHAQDAAFDRDDINLTWWANTIGDREVREYRFADHTNIYQAITALAREGWFDWWCSYVTGGRVMNFQARRRTSHRARARVHVNDAGTSNVATITKARTTGATSIAAQTRNQDNGNHEHAARTPGLTLEEIFVADREPADYDLPALANNRAHLTAQPEALTVETHAGDDRYHLAINLGDTTDITSTQPGAKANGRYRLTRRTTHPDTDSCELAFNPEQAVTL